MVDSFEFLSLIMVVIAGIITILAWNKKYKWSALLLFLDFIFMTAYDQFIISSVTFTDEKQYAIFYGYKLLIQAVFSIGYLHLQNKSLFMLSNSIIAILVISIAISLSGMDVVFYVGIMIALSVCQLIAGFGGAIGGYCNIFNKLRNNISVCWHKTLLKMVQK